MKFTRSSIPSKIRRSFFAYCRCLISESLNCDANQSCFYDYRRDPKTGVFFIKITFKNKTALYREGEKPSFFQKAEKFRFVGAILTGRLCDFEESMRVTKTVVRAQKWRMLETTEKFFCKYCDIEYIKQTSPRRHISDERKEELKFRMIHYHRDREEHFAKCPVCETVFDCNDRREGSIKCIKCEKYFSLNIDTLVRFSEI